MRRSTTSIIPPSAAESHGPTSISVRRAVAADLPEIVALDEAVTGLAKDAYWRDVFERYGEHRQDERFFLVAEAADDERRIAGFIIGEIRAWEFGSEPCGWVFAFSVRPEVRLKGVGRQLFAVLSKAFRHAGVRTMRTMVARDNTLHMMFFRSEGMMAGRYLQLEKSLDDDLEGAAS
jgi:ribosomal protein S18 acetylase RimI-like enzyme